MSTWLRFILAATVVKSTVVLQVDFPELLEGAAVTTVEPEVIFAEVLTNLGSDTVGNTFHITTTMQDTHTFVFEVRWCVLRRTVASKQNRRNISRLRAGVRGNFRPPCGTPRRR